MTDGQKIFLGAILLVAAQTLSWFQLNMQFVNEWWEKKGLLSVFIFGIPCGLCFWYAWKLTASGMGNKVWSARFMSYGLSYLTFPVLTYFLLKESMFTVKTISCIFLSILIILIQTLG